MRTRISVFLITLSGLVLEVGLTRIYSASIWYHFAFVAISVALLGWGLGGFTVHLLKQRVRLTMQSAALVTVLYAGAIPLCLRLLVRYPFEMDRLPLYFLAPLLPFFLAGMALSIIFDLQSAVAGSLYFFDLLGAALGAVLITLLLYLLGGEAALLTGAIAPATAAVLLTFSPASPAEEKEDKRAAQFDGKPSFLALSESESEESTRGLLSGSTRWLAVAAVVLTAAAAFSAIKFGMFRVIPGTTKAMRRQMDASPGSRIAQTGWNSYSRIDEVETIQSEGRNFISRTNRKFDIILLGFVDSWASVASGGLSLSENYLYTAEAFRAYYDHLSDDGILVILRWDSDIPRLVSNSVATLGADAASKRIVTLLEKQTVADQPAQMLFMLRKRPFTAAETREIRDQWTQAAPIIMPGGTAPPLIGDLLAGKKTMV